MMNPGMRKMALCAHIAASVGWIGAVLAFLALAIAGLMSVDAEKARAAYVCMDLIGWCVLVPLSLASLVTGLVQATGTKWGLFQHYWVVVKLAITVVATIVLLLHMQPIGHVAAAAAKGALSAGDLRGLRIQLVANAGAAAVVLLVALGLAVFKPRGLTAVGRSKLAEVRQTDPQLAPVANATVALATPRWVRVLWMAVGAAILLVIVLHLSGRGFRPHR
jgi:hypothetical protein